MTIVDTTVWIDYLRGSANPETEYLDRRLAQERFALTDIILSEVLQGIDDEKSFAAVHRQLLKFELFETGGELLAVESARNFRSLRRRGLTVRRTIDCLIATFCVLNGHSLLHRDRDFAHFERFVGLKVIHP